LNSICEEHKFLQSLEQLFWFDEYVVNQSVRKYCTFIMFTTTEIDLAKRALDIKPKAINTIFSTSDNFQNYKIMPYTVYLLFRSN